MTDTRATLPELAARILAETPVALAQLAKELPSGRKGAPTSLACILRWVLKGARAPDGTLARLEAVRLGGRWVSSRAALSRFMARLTPETGDDRAPARTPRQQRQGAERAERELNRLGI